MTVFLDGIGGRFVLETHPKRSSVVHFDTLNRERRVGVFRGDGSRDLAVLSIIAIIDHDGRHAGQG